MIQRVEGEFPGKNEDSRNSAAPDAADEREIGSIDLNLRALIERWPDLPDQVKDGIVAMVQATGG